MRRAQPHWNAPDSAPSSGPGPAAASRSPSTPCTSSPGDRGAGRGDRRADAGADQRPTARRAAPDSPGTWPRCANDAPPSARTRPKPTTRPAGRRRPPPAPSLRLSADDVLLSRASHRNLRIARAAADRGRKAAFWALRAGRTEDAIGCLEAGRSLVLGAAAVSAGVADQLAALGENDLAERWREAAAGSAGERGDDRSLLKLTANAGRGRPADPRHRTHWNCSPPRLGALPPPR
ncbi:hypothetical protein LT493_23170 [Streptomyces tricolor]|nr:hypothetical protein [Streptomyces tricolor]